MSFFEEFFASIKNEYFGRGTGQWAIIISGLDTVLAFPNFLRS